MGDVICTEHDVILRKVVELLDLPVFGTKTTAKRDELARAMADAGLYDYDGDQEDEISVSFRPHAVTCAGCAERLPAFTSHVRVGEGEVLIFCVACGTSHDDAEIRTAAAEITDEPHLVRSTPEIEPAPVVRDFRTAEQREQDAKLNGAWWRCEEHGITHDPVQLCHACYCPAPNCMRAVLLVSRWPKGRAK